MSWTDWTILAGVFLVGIWGLRALIAGWYDYMADCSDDDGLD